MIEISINRDLADVHPGFMAGCAQRGHAVNVFDSAAPEARPHESASAATHLAGDAAARVSTGDRTPGIEDRTD